MQRTVASGSAARDRTAAEHGSALHESRTPHVPGRIRPHRTHPRPYLERDDILLGIGDDAALQPRANEQLVVTADTLNSGVHFPVETPAFDIGWKTLAVNLSDLAAMARARRVHAGTVTAGSV